MGLPSASLTLSITAGVIRDAGSGAAGCAWAAECNPVAIKTRTAAAQTFFIMSLVHFYMHKAEISQLRMNEAAQLKVTTTNLKAHYVKNVQSEVKQMKIARNSR
ncbi:hypothetical protein [Pannonibacter phragmitetus]|uniref:hypothetical protein n=1 Tax=Pannonibacter phragmitetus TaxID=121719 RepID=UPI00146E8CEA|nr:hypothetical protein [Pannonibacter phragmitetus]